MRRKLTIPSKEQLYEAYIIKKLTTRQCANLFDMSQPWIRKYMKLYGIKPRIYGEWPGPNTGKKFSKKHKHKISIGLIKNNGMKGKFFEAHPNFKSGIRSYRKYLTRGLLAAICVHCGGVKNLIVHHMDGNRDHNDLSNLMILCASCHKKWHLAHPSRATLERMEKLLGQFSR